LNIPFLTGYERDAETNLDFAQARYYGNLLGRFTSVDPFDGSGLVEEPQSWNRYSYVTNQPTITTDPLGLLATKYFIDGIEASADDVRRLISAGWGVIAPADIVRYNSRLFNGQGGFEHFRATADGNAGWGYYSSVTSSAIDDETQNVLAKSSHTEFHWTRSLGRMAGFQGQLAFLAGGQYYNATGGLIGESPLEMEMLGPVDYVLPGGLIKGSLKVVGTKALIDVTSKPRTIDKALELAIKWLRSGYKEVGQPGCGVFRSADGLRQFRMVTADIMGRHGKIGPHVHLEKLNSAGEVIKNIHTPIF
jgi:RHS repeat-associated protein